MIHLGNSTSPPPIGNSPMSKWFVSGKHTPFSSEGSSFTGHLCLSLFNPTKQKNTHVAGWWLTTYPSEKYEFVSWDDDIPNIWKNKNHVPRYQPGCLGVKILGKNSPFHPQSP